MGSPMLLSVQKMKIKKGQRGRLDALPGGFCALMHTDYDLWVVCLRSVVPVLVFAVATAS